MTDTPLHDMTGRTALVTGANRGIGREVAAGLARAGARTVLLCRSRARGEAALAELRAELPDADLRLVCCDLADLGSVEAAAAGLLSRDGHLDVLVHNAGLFPQERTLTADGVELTFAVDVLGPFLLTHRLLPLLRRASRHHGHARVVQLAGIYHLEGEIDLDDLHFADRPYDPAEANAQAQLARVVLARAWSRVLARDRIRINAVHPGPVLTDALEQAPWVTRVLAHTLARPAFHTPRVGAAPVLRLATDPRLHVTGAFYRRDELHAGAEASHDARLAEELWAACGAMILHPDRQPVGMTPW